MSTSKTGWSGLTLGALALVGLSLAGCDSWPWSQSDAGSRAQQASAPPAGLENIAPQAGGPATARTTTTPPLTSVVAAPIAPPPAPDEVVPPQPSPTMVWVPGYWSFDGTNWTWVSGQYQTPPRPTAQWVPGHWVPQSGGGGVWVWVAGRWS